MVPATVICVCFSFVVSLCRATVVPFWKHGRQAMNCSSGGNKTRLCTPVPGKYDGMQILIDVTVGGQQQRVQFDTGSSDLAVFSTDCEGLLGNKCGKHVFAPYDGYKSGKMVKCKTSNCAGQQTKCYESYNPLSSLDGGCQYDNVYGDNSGFSAIVYQDSFGFNGESGSTTINVGAIFDQHGGEGQDSFEPEDSDGIFGTGFMSISASNPNAKYNPAVALAKSQGKPGLFSMCFAEGGGAFGIGEVLPYFEGEFVTEPVVPQRTVPGGKHGYWTVSVQDVKVLGKSLGVPSSYYNHNECIVDSGTTVFMLPEPAFNSLANALMSNCAQSKLRGVCVDDDGKTLDPSDGNTILNGAPFALSEADIEQFPAIDIVMTQATVSVPPSAYVRCIAADAHYARSCFLLLQPGEMTMLGDGMLAGSLTVYDQDNMQLRFAKVKGCPAPESLAATTPAAPSAVIV